jgi:ABC-2 type transport system ATP-binding protein
VLTTHYLDEAEALCDRVAIMDDGKILKLDTPRALVRDLDAPVRITLDRGRLDARAAGAIEGVDGVTDDGTALVLSTRRPSDVLTALAERQTLDGLQVRGATLEDVFLDLTGRAYRA